MATITCRKPRVKPERTIRLLAQLPSGAGTFRITEGKAVDTYYFAPIPSDFGRAFTVEKLGEEIEDAPLASYAVCLNGEHSLCHCDGFNYRSYCRHISGLATLIAEGRLS